MVYLRNKFYIQWKLSSANMGKIPTIIKYLRDFLSVGEYKFIIIDFEGSIDNANYFIENYKKELPEVIGYKFNGIPFLRYNKSDDKDEKYTSLTKKEVYEKWNTNELIKNSSEESLAENFICTCMADSLTIEKDGCIYAGICPKKRLIKSELGYYYFHQPLNTICNQCDCNLPFTKVNIKHINIRKDVCMENPMFYIKWRLFNNCNYHCNYCIRKDFISHDSLSIEILKAKAKNFNRMKIPFRLEFIGGEPTLISIKDIVEVITTNNLRAIYISTNFYQSIEYFEELSEYLKSRNIELSLSCSYHGEGEDFFKEFTDKAIYLSNKGIVDNLYIEYVACYEDASCDDIFVRLKEICNANRKIKLSIDPLRDRNDNLLCSFKEDVRRGVVPLTSIITKNDLLVNHTYLKPHYKYSGFVSAGMNCKSLGLYVDEKDNVYRRSCKQKKVISNLNYYDFNIETNVIECPNSICNFSSNVEVFN